MSTPDIACISYFRFICCLLVSRYTCRTRARSASALPTKATPPPPLAVGEPPETPFTTKKEIRRGEISKNQRVFLVGRSTACRARRRGWRSLSLFRLLTSLTLGTWRIPQIVGWLPQGRCFWLWCGKIGSSEDKNSLQIRIFYGKVARKGGFFGGGAQRQPRVFQGGDLRLPCLRHGFFVCYVGIADTLRVVRSVI